MDYLRVVVTNRDVEEGRLGRFISVHAVYYFSENDLYLNAETSSVTNESFASERLEN